MFELYISLLKFFSLYLTVFIGIIALFTKPVFYKFGFLDLIAMIVFAIFLDVAEAKIVFRGKESYVEFVAAYRLELGLEEMNS